MGGYDSHLFVRNLGETKGNIECVPDNEGKYISFSKYVVVGSFINKEGKRNLKERNLHNMADGHVFLAPKADRFISRPRLVKTSSLPDLSKVYTDSTLVVADQINNKNMSTSVPEYGSLSSSFEMSEMAAIKNALNGRSVNSLKVKDLRDELEKRKLSKSGRKTELVKRLKESILSGSGEIQIPRHNVNQPSPRPSAVINLDDTSSSPEQQSHTCNGYKSLKDLYDRLENEVNKLKDSYRSRLTDSREIQSTCKSCQNQQRIQEENRALREQLQLMKGNLDKTKEERDSLQMVVSLLSKELYNFRLDSKEAFNESPSVDPKVSDTKWSDTKADTKQNNGSSKSQSSKTTKNHQSKSSKKKPPNKSSHNSSNTLNHNQERSSPTTVIIGDSIIRNIQGWQLGKEVGHRVVVKSFAGATTSDMSHYVKPTLDKKPDQIILHAGTNDLGKLSPSEIADNIVDLAREIESSTDAQVIISELVTRSDLSDSGNVDAVNKRLRKFCNQRQWHFILHDDIHSTDLNRGGLHLGETGIAKMYNNFANKLHECN